MLDYQKEEGRKGERRERRDAKRASASTVGRVCMSGGEKVCVNERSGDEAERGIE